MPANPPIYECSHGHAVIDPPVRPKRCPATPHGRPCDGAIAQTCGAGARSAA